MSVAGSISSSITGFKGSMVPSGAFLPIYNCTASEESRPRTISKRFMTRGDEGRELMQRQANLEAFKTVARGRPIPFIKQQDKITRVIPRIFNDNYVIDVDPILVQSKTVPGYLSNEMHNDESYKKIKPDKYAESRTFNHTIGPSINNSVQNTTRPAVDISTQYIIPLNGRTIAANPSREIGRLNVDRRVNISGSTTPIVHMPPTPRLMRQNIPVQFQKPHIQDVLVIPERRNNPSYGLFANPLDVL